MLVPQGYDLKASEPIGHLGAVFLIIFTTSLACFEIRKIRHLTCGRKGNLIQGKLISLKNRYIAA